MLNHHPARLGVHGPYGTGNIGVYSINSSSNSNTEIPMPMFTNGQRIQAIPRSWKININNLAENIQKQSSKGALRNFAKFTGKDLCQSLLFNKVAGLTPGLTGVFL